MYRTNWLRGVLVAALLPAALAGCARQEPAASDDAPGEWRQWRGPNGQGVSLETDLPSRWSGDSVNVRWRAPIPGTGNSSPIVSNGRVFVTASWGQQRFGRLSRHDRLNRALIALDLATGETLWERVVFTTDQERRHHLNTPAAVTPAADGERVYVYFGMGLAAYDYDGNQLWIREVDPNYIERARYGVVSSPIVVGDAVIVVRDDEWGGDEVDDISWLAAFDRRTGRELWRSENDETCCSYTTPVVRRTGSGAELVFASTPFIAAYDPRSGDRLWTIDHTLRQIVPTALVADDLLILPGSVHHRSIAVWQLSGEGAGTRAETLWGGASSAPKLPSPVLDGNGNLVLVTDNGILLALDPRTGRKHWQQRLKGGNFHASLVWADGKIYATSDDCVTSVVNSRGRNLAVNRIDGRCEASPAIAGGAILIRTDQELYCIEKFERTGATKTATDDEPEGKRKKKKKKKARKGQGEKPGAPDAGPDG